MPLSYFCCEKPKPRFIQNRKRRFRAFIGIFSTIEVAPVVSDSVLTPIEQPFFSINHILPFS